MGPNHHTNLPTTGLRTRKCLPSQPTPNSIYCTSETVNIACACYTSVTHYQEFAEREEAEAAPIHSSPIAVGRIISLWLFLIISCTHEGNPRRAVVKT
jgi:hypothetical protein